MSTFTVQPGGLYTLANDLSGLATTLDTESRVRGDYWGRSGSPTVDQALEDFFKHWSDGLNTIQQHLTALSARVSDAADFYTSTEHQIEQAGATSQGQGSRR
jgi:hypothetical protein